MKTTIYCRVTEQGIHSFYMKVDGKRYYLFTQNYRKGVQDYFSGGVSVDQAMDFSKTHGDDALMRTMTKLPYYIKDIENEFHVTVLRQTQKKRSRNYRYDEMKYAC